MRDRLKRRKKPQETQPSEPAQAPLQPAYFDSDSAAPAEEAPEAAAPEPVEPETIPTPAEAEPPTEAAPVPGAGNRPRRRRGRGGRGRGGRSSQSRSDAQPVAVGTEASPAQELAPVTPAVQIPVAPPRPPKGTVILAIGLPGSGKSSWFKRHNITPLSSDMLRVLLFDDAHEQRFQDLVFSNLRSMLKARLIARRPLNYVDATNLTPHERHSWIRLAKDYGYEVQAVFFDVPVEVCLERNRRRERVVDEDVLRRMAAKLKPPTFEEGFSKVTVVRVKKKDADAS